MAGITVSEIAEQIRGRDEDLTVVIDRLRNWTKEGLLRPLGEKNPGTGRKRRYPETAIIDAMLLTVLTDQIGMAAVKTTRFKKLFQAAHGFWSRPPRIQQFAVVSLSPAETAVGTFRLDGLAAFFESNPDAVHIVINLNHLFERLNKSHEDRHRG
jgi:hypothetical protein